MYRRPLIPQHKYVFFRFYLLQGRDGLIVWCLFNCIRDCLRGKIGKVELRSSDYYTP